LRGRKKNNKKVAFRDERVNEAITALSITSHHIREKEREQHGGRRRKRKTGDAIDKRAVKEVRVRGLGDGAVPVAVDTKATACESCVAKDLIDGLTKDTS
jgi:hypothetical protein